MGEQVDVACQSKTCPLVYTSNINLYKLIFLMPEDTTAWIVISSASIFEYRLRPREALLQLVCGLLSVLG